MCWLLICCCCVLIVVVWCLLFVVCCCLLLFGVDVWCWSDVLVVAVCRCRLSLFVGGCVLLCVLFVVNCRVWQMVVMCCCLVSFGVA